MDFLRLPDQLLSILFENEEIIAIDKPYGISSHTNDSKQGNGDNIHFGLIETYEKRLGQKLFIVHRLDQTTTGVIIFAKSVEAAKKYAQFFFDREVKKTYLFITAARSKKENFLINKKIVHKAKDLDAETELKFLQRHSRFELWQANPHTGRNHQIRIHAQEAQISILGDTKYNGEAFPFICLHNQRIEFPNGIVITSRPPIYYENLKLLENQILAKALFETDRRDRLYNLNPDSTQSLRLVHNKNDFKDLGFTVDQYGRVLLLSYYTEKWTSADETLFKYFANSRQKPIIVRLMHNRGKDPTNKSQFFIFPDQYASSELPSVWTSQENNISYEIRSDSGQSFGLFLDQRLQRNWVLHNSREQEVLNLFSYTCGFSVAAALGGASQVTSVDTSKNVLNWGKRNFALNSLEPEKHKFLHRDSLDYLALCLKKEIKYDLIICDPPSFSRGENGIFKIENRLEDLLKMCLGSLKKNGVLLFSTNFENFYIDDIRKSILKVQAQLGIKFLNISCIPSACDFELEGQRSILKSFLIRKSDRAFARENLGEDLSAVEVDET